MPAPEFFRHSFIGQVIYYASGRRLLRYPEEKQGYVVPTRYLHSRATTTSDKSLVYNNKQPPPKGLATPPEPLLPPDESTVGQEYFHPHGSLDEEAQKHHGKDYDPDLVSWDGPDDPEAPLNWSSWKKACVLAQVSLHTLSIYIGASIYGPGIGDLSEKFGISEVAGSLGITMFVLGYATGPMVLAPLSEIPRIGRTPIYVLTLLVFVLLQIPTALSKNLGALLPLRFLAGFFGSPALSTGGATLADVYKPEDCAVVIGIWSVLGFGGPALGPIMGGFAAEAKGWTWTIWILMWMSGAAVIILAFTMPETSAQAILYRRADRLRRATGNMNLHTQAERDGMHVSVSELAMTTLVRPFILAFLEPIVFSWNLYLALLYGLLYCWIESFGVVFVGMHGFSLGENGLAFISVVVGACLAFLGFFPWIKYVMNPKFVNGTFTPEDRMPVAMVGAITMPIALFWFGWTSSPSIHWISPILAAVFWAMANYLMFQAGINYLLDCYPRYVASILAGSTLMRSALGASFPLFSNAFFNNLGVGPACSILGGITALMIPIPFVLYKYGPRIRSWSKYAN
ncbi:MFS general substrate transporter [Trametopsis cervina]|nr:MFS general substrate transporter [Trametopsis cervina]